MPTRGSSTSRSSCLAWAAWPALCALALKLLQNGGMHVRRFVTAVCLPPRELPARLLCMLTHSSASTGTAKKVVKLATVRVRRYYPDLGSNMTADDLATQYLVTGRGTNRVAGRLRVVAAYSFAWPGRDPSPYAGLCNQWYMHITMMAILLQMGAEVVRAAPVHTKPRP